jgi:hypothetical protein
MLKNIKPFVTHLFFNLNFLCGRMCILFHKRNNKGMPTISKTTLMGIVHNYVYLKVNSFYILSNHIPTILIYLGPKD